MAKRVADVIVESLQGSGVKRCRDVPSDTLNYVTDAIRRSDIEWVHVRHEEVAGFAAGAEAMLAGNLTACAGACGPVSRTAEAVLVFSPCRGEKGAKCTL
jgi:pyruvate dehydrogenase (quinone)